MKWLGVGLLLIPIIFLLVFLIGEVEGGDKSGFVHLGQLAPLLGLLLISAKRPTLGGVMLLLSAIFMGAWYWISAPFNIQTILLVEGMLFLPMLFAGILLIIIGKKHISK